MALRVPGQLSPAAQPAPTPVAPPSGPAQVAAPVDLVREVTREVGAVLAVADQARIANQTIDIPNFANAVTGIYGISGAGKTSLAVTAIEFAWENFEAISLVYATDLGGFGNKLLSLVRLGIARVWDPRNHVNSFETMEMISLGGWPEHILDPETGKADPNVRIILPRRIVTTLCCPQGHAVARFDLATIADATAFEVYNAPCPTCQVVTSKGNGRTLAQIVRHKMFSRVGHRVFDSLTEMNDWGALRLTEMSAKGLLPTGKEGGSLLGGVDALREGSIVYGGGSMSQVGFMQNRSYQWIANIRSIPDQVMPATCTFAVEQGKADDDSGGVPILGPQIAGNARTAKVPRWVGNCLHASREPDTAGNMRYRLWLTSHLDSRDSRKLPYLAKHRGIPLDMPDFLEDPWADDPAKRAELAWTGCSLKVFYTKLIEQLTKLEAIDRARYKNAPALTGAIDETGDEVIGDVAAPAMMAPSVAAGPRVPVSGGQTLSARRSMGLRVPGAVAPAPGPPPVTIPVQTVAIAGAVAPAPVATAPATQPAGGIPAGLVVAPPAAGSGNSTVTVSDPTPVLSPASGPVGPAADAAKSVIHQQLEASLAVRTAAKQAETAAASGTAVSSPPAQVTPATTSSPSRLRSPGALRTPGTAATAAPPATTGVATQPAAPVVAPTAVAAAAVVAPHAIAPHAIAPAPPPVLVAPAPPSRMSVRRIPRPPV